MDRITIRRPDDFHVHLRQDGMLKRVVAHTARDFARALVMPNIRMPSMTASAIPPPVRSAEDATWYRARIERAARAVGYPGFRPLMTVALTDRTSPEEILAANKAGVVAAKVYPAGLTTNSEHGVTDLRAVRLEGTLTAMENCGMVLSVHGEAHGAFCMDRESEFLRHTLKWVVGAHPSLKVVLEHITTAEAVRWVNALRRNVAATVTVHHLFLTLDDVVGDLLRPHNFCKPIAKRPSDRDALREAALSGSPKFFLGTDSAPHDVRAKERDGGCAGVFTAPIAMPLLAECFDRAGKLDRLEAFVSAYGADFYGLPRNEGTLTLERAETRVPGAYDGIVPFRAGDAVAWRVAY